jgi:large subunit ribosomal protein L23
MRPPEQIIKRPLLTEKGTLLKETGGRSDEPDAESLSSQVLFEVVRDANKVEIRHAVEKVFNVKVSDVRTQAREGKWKRMGKFEGRRRSWKKAMVTLAPGHKIELVEGA